MPQDLLAIINQYGGKMKQTYGVPVKEIQEAIKHGVRKINIDTDIRMAMTGAVRKFLAENPDKFDAREWLKPAREAAKPVCKQRYLEFGCEGQGAKIKGDTPAGHGRQVRQGRTGAGGEVSLQPLLAIIAGPAHGCAGLFFFKSHAMTSALHTSTLTSLPLLARGKVRDNYAVGDDRILMVASDRISAFDVIMGEPIPGKGELLTQMALFWFDKLGPKGQHLPQST